MPRKIVRWIQLWDGRVELGWISHGLPTFEFGQAPQGLATRRQLREVGLCPGGHEFVAQIEWDRGRQWAGLYRLDLAQPKRTASLSQRRALAAAMAARRRCFACQRDAGRCLPTSTRLCETCDPETTAVEYDTAA